MITAADMHLNFKKIVINLFIFLGICFSSFAFATDYSITSSTTSQITLNNSDTLTVSGGGSIVYTGAAATTGPACSERPTARTFDITDSARF